MTTSRDSRKAAPRAGSADARDNGIPILGHQEPGGITEQTVRRLMRLQGAVQPDQIISLLEIGGPTYAMRDHADRADQALQVRHTEDQRRYVRLQYGGDWNPGASVSRLPSPGRSWQRGPCPTSRAGRCCSCAGR